MSYVDGYQAYARGVEWGAVPWDCDSPLDWQEGWGEAEFVDLASRQSRATTG